MFTSNPIKLEIVTHNSEAEFNTLVKHLLDNSPACFSTNTRKDQSVYVQDCEDVYITSHDLTGEFSMTVAKLYINDDGIPNIFIICIFPFSPTMWSGKTTVEEAINILATVSKAYNQYDTFKIKILNDKFGKQEFSRYNFTGSNCEEFSKFPDILNNVVYWIGQTGPQQDGLVIFDDVANGSIASIDNNIEFLASAIYHRHFRKSHSPERVEFFTCVNSYDKIRFINVKLLSKSEKVRQLTAYERISRILLAIPAPKTSVAVYSGVLSWDKSEWMSSKDVKSYWEGIVDFCVE